MKEVLIPTVVNCQNCKTAIPFPVGLVALNKAQLQALGSQTHAKNGLICVKPMLTIMFVHALVSNCILNPNESETNETNGVDIKA